MLEELKKKVYKANLDLVKHNKLRLYETKRYGCCRLTDRKCCGR